MSSYGLLHCMYNAQTLSEKEMEQVKRRRGGGNETSEETKKRRQ